MDTAAATAEDGSAATWTSPVSVSRNRRTSAACCSWSAGASGALCGASTRRSISPSPSPYAPSSVASSRAGSSSEPPLSNDSRTAVPVRSSSSTTTRACPGCGGASKPGSWPARGPDRSSSVSSPASVVRASGTPAIRPGRPGRPPAGISVAAGAGRKGPVIVMTPPDGRTGTFPTTPSAPIDAGAAAGVRYATYTKWGSSPCGGTASESSDRRASSGVLPAPGGGIAIVGSVAGRPDSSTSWGVRRESTRTSSSSSARASTSGACPVPRAVSAPTMPSRRLTFPANVRSCGVIGRSMWIRSARTPSVTIGRSRSATSRAVRPIGRPSPAVASRSPSATSPAASEVDHAVGRRRVRQALDVAGRRRGRRERVAMTGAGADPEQEHRPAGPGDRQHAERGGRPARGRHAGRRFRPGTAGLEHLDGVREQHQPLRLPDDVQGDGEVDRPRPDRAARQHAAGAQAVQDDDTGLRGARPRRRIAERLLPSDRVEGRRGGCPAATCARRTVGSSTSPGLPPL